MGSRRIRGGQLHRWQPCRDRRAEPQIRHPLFGVRARATSRRRSTLRIRRDPLRRAHIAGRALAVMSGKLWENAVEMADRTDVPRRRTASYLVKQLLLLNFCAGVAAGFIVVILERCTNWSQVVEVFGRSFVYAFVIGSMITPSF